uniref:PROP1-like PPR domain-containing protein n=1 Tax=Kalanchoe fedtschenkoi TaxID=63787 RepID=A0A7N0TZ08_KALFE
MDSLKSSSAFVSPLPKNPKFKPYRKPKNLRITASTTPDPWSLSSGNPDKPKPYSKNPKKALSDDNARRIIKAKAKYLSELRRNQGPQAQTPRWIRRTPEQMVRYLEDERHGHLYGKHVVAAIKAVRGLAGKKEGEYDMRRVMASFVTKLTFREMCVVLKEQRGWRQAMEFFDWMKLQLSYRPSVIPYTILLRIYGQVGKIKLAEQTFLEMLEVGCEPDEVACGTMLCTYAKWGRDKAMLAFYSAVQQRGVLLSVQVYNFMISSLQKKSLHGKVIDVWREMMERGVVPNSFTYTVVISSLVKEGISEEAFETFYEMRNSEFVPEEVTYNLLINLCSKNGDREGALKLYEDMRSLNIVPSNFTCASLLTLYYKNEDYSKALSLFSEMARYKVVVDEVIYGLLIRIYGKLGLFEDASNTFDEMENVGILTDEKTYLAMAQVHLSSGSFQKALRIMELMRSRKILFSRFAFIVLLQCYVKMEDIGSAESTFQALSKTGLPDAISCNHMLSMYKKSGLLDKAKGFLCQIRNNGVHFDEELYKTAMSVYCKEGMLTDAELLMEEMLAKESFKDSKFLATCLLFNVKNRQRKCEEFRGEPDLLALRLMFGLYLDSGCLGGIEEVLNFICGNVNGLSLISQLIKKFIKEDETSKAEAIWEQLVKLQHMPEDAAIALISLYGKQQKLRQAKEIFTFFSDNGEVSIPLHNVMVDAYAKCGKSDEAYQLYNGQAEKGHDMGAVSISIVVSSLTRCGKYKEAENIIRRSFDENVALDTVAFNTFIKAALEAGKLQFATTIYERMMSMGLSPSIQTICTMISVYGRGRKLDKALEIFSEGRKGVPLDEKAYTNLISYLGKAGRSHEARLLFNEMREVGIKPGRVSYNVMMNVYATSGLHTEAEELFQAMRLDDLPPDSRTYLAIIQANTTVQNHGRAENLIDFMEHDGIEATSAHYNLLLSAFFTAGLIRDADRIFNKLSASGTAPDVSCCRTMLRGYMDHGYVSHGITFFESLSKSIEPDRFIWSAAVHLYKSAGDETKAENTLNSMSTLGITYLKHLEVGSRGESMDVLKIESSEAVKQLSSG